MSDIKNIFDIAGRGMSAQMLRLNTVASNLANARSVASSEAEAYRAIKPVFNFGLFSLLITLLQD